MRVVQIILGIFIGSIGLAIAGFGIFLAIEPIDWVTRIGILVPTVGVGSLLVTAGVLKTRGEEIGEMIRDAFIYLSW